MRLQANFLLKDAASLLRDRQPESGVVNALTKEGIELGENGSKAPTEADAIGNKNLLAAVVSSASDVARPPLAVASFALLLMLFRRGLDVTMMIRSWLPPC